MTTKMPLLTKNKPPQMESGVPSRAMVPLTVAGETRLKTLQEGISRIFLANFTALGQHIGPRRRACRYGATASVLKPRLPNLIWPGLPWLTQRRVVAG